MVTFLNVATVKRSAGPVTRQFHRAEVVDNEGMYVGGEVGSDLAETHLLGKVRGNAASPFGVLSVVVATLSVCRDTGCFLPPSR